MTDFSQLSVDTIPGYLRGRTSLAEVIDASSITSVCEVGDGNLNLVFIIRDAHGASLVVKQSLPHVRTDPSWPMTRERSAREARVLSLHGSIDPPHVPVVYDYDAAEYALAIEDLSDHEVWRTELGAGRVHAGAAAELGRYVARTAFATSLDRIGAAQHAALVARSLNPELCEITRELVFTEPYVDHPHNAVLAANRGDVLALQNDQLLLDEIAWAKHRFMTATESLIHGDLHTGSVFVRAATAGHPLSVRAFDSEFGFVGPTGFDLGVLWANLVLAAARQTALGRPDLAREILRMPGELLDAFEAEYRALWSAAHGLQPWRDVELTDRIAGIRAAAAVFAGAECIRRIVGFAKASDIETLPESLRPSAARAVLAAGRALTVSRVTRLTAPELFEQTARMLRVDAQDLTLA